MALRACNPAVGRADTALGYRARRDAQRLMHQLGAEGFDLTAEREREGGTERERQGETESESATGTRSPAPRCTEEQRLPPSVSSTRRVSHNSADRTLETQAQHTVCLVDDENTATALIRHASSAT